MDLKKKRLKSGYSFSINASITTPDHSFNETYLTVSFTTKIYNKCIVFMSHLNGSIKIDVRPKLVKSSNINYQNVSVC